MIFVKLIPSKRELCSAYYCCYNFGKDVIQIGTVSGKGDPRRKERVRWARRQRHGARSREPGESGEVAQEPSLWRARRERRPLELLVVLKLGREWEPLREGCVHVCGGGETFKHRRNEG